MNAAEFKTETKKLMEESAAKQAEYRAQRDAATSKDEYNYFQQLMDNDNKRYTAEYNRLFDLYLNT